ncbi:T9SS type A sorting domain-containing protein [Lutimonas halocynthiae]|uniref:T9SS type A sorting domain-containing protein n=1 Tax=Lutimonas halocynthiae TaxID=1446477 RepID=UPI0025B61062|nr:T9SS type A sorting domain-containing protein [Lutimonas halocynthiae]MDN3643371.1 T9SS type A sorting domain-containing protein [Lutimonas halocynthiae]
MKIKLIILYLFLYSFGAYAQETPPVLSNFRIENDQRNRVYFDSGQPIKGSNVVGFKISGNSLIGININSGQTTGHYFSVSKPFTFWDNNTIRYEGGSNLSDVNSNLLNNFTLKYISNNINEPIGNGKIFYVSVNGLDSNSGLELSQAWRTIRKAAEKAREGDVVYIEAGDYGNEYVIIKNSGTNKNPIKFIGFENTPGDRPILNRSQTTSFSPNKMPYIHSISLDGNGINLSGRKNIIIKNIQVEGYNDGIVLRSDASYNVLDNVYAKGAKRMAINGFSKGSISNTYRSVYLANTSAVGIRISGERHLIEDFYVSSNGVKSMDYYISLYGGHTGTGNIVRNSSVVRDPRDSHTGHGISVKAEGYPLEHTLIENCQIQDVGQGIELRHHQVKYTIVRNVTATGNRNSTSNLITFRDDTSDNVVENCTAKGVYEGIRFLMNKGEDLGIQGGGHRNKIINSIFDNCRYNITVNGLGGTPLESTFNEFLNCTFYNSDYMFALPISYGKTNKFINCIIDKVKKNVYGNGKLSAEFNYSNFYQSFSKPAGLSNMSKNPNFENSEKSNFRLKENSELIDKGLKLKEVKVDYDGNHRPQGNGLDIGAFEYNDSSTSYIDPNAGPDQSICRGEQVTLVASGGSSYKWSTGQTTKQIEVSPESTTIYTVVVNSGNASGSDEVTINVVDIQADAGQDRNITKGDEITLTASGAKNYIWSNGMTGSRISVSPDETTVYTVTASEGDCQSTDEITVTVSDKVQVDTPTVVANAGLDRTICNGETVVLSASGGSSYLWSTGARTKSIEVSPNESNKYVVTVSEGSVTDTDEVLVEVISVKANAGNDVSINQGESVKLSASGGTDYLWSNGARTSSIVVQPSNTQIYSVQVSNGNCSDEDKVEVKVLQQILNPSSSVIDAGEDQTICFGESLTLNAQGANNYQWSTGESGNQIVVNPLRTETYNVTTVLNGVTISDSITITVENCDSDSADDNSFEGDLSIQLFPNPTSGIIKIQTSTVNSDTDMHLINMNGKILYQETLKSQQGNFGKQLDLSNYTKGIYFLRFFSDQEQLVKKIVLI